MRASFVHRAVLALDPGSDDAAPGGAVTLSLCGRWDHDGGCTWPHHSHVAPGTEGLEIRTVFAAEPSDEWLVRDRIDKALAAGSVTGPGGRVSTWRLRESGAVTMRESETVLAERLARRS